jgi:REP element-mobilizing transposase RayT
LDHAGAIWHVTSRGNERRPIFRGDEDRRLFLEIVASVVRRFLWRLHAYVLMGNHYHLLLETPQPNLCRGMHRLNGTYASTFNRRHARAGHLLQGRYKAILVEREPHLLELARYVVLNPVRAGFVKAAARWRWSSYRATAGLAEPPAWLTTDWLLSQFGSATDDARRGYRAFVASALAREYEPWKTIDSGIYLGSLALRQKAEPLVAARAPSSEFSRADREPIPLPIGAIVEAASRAFAIAPADLRRRRRTDARLAVAYLARHDLRMKLGEYGAALGVTPWSASRLASEAERRTQRDARFRARLERLRRTLADHSGRARDPQRAGHAQIDKL